LFVILQVHFSSAGMDVLHSHVDKNILPEELGGPLTLEEAEDKDIMNSIFENESYYEGKSIFCYFYTFLKMKFWKTLI